MSRTSETLGVSELLSDTEIIPADAVTVGKPNGTRWTRVSSDSIVKVEQRHRLTFRSPAEIVAMVFTDSDKIIGDRLIAEGQGAAWLGEAGIGKSRLINQACACVVTGRDFVGLETANSGLRWLFIQSENSNRRLKKDLEKLRDWLGETAWQKFCVQVRFHTVETDDDGFISLDDPDNLVAIDDEIQRFQPGVVVFDPLNEMGGGDLNSDMEMRRTLRAIMRVAKRGNPDRAVIIVHHSLTGKAGASRATGYDRTSFGRNSKSLVAWARAQINIAPGSGDQQLRERVVMIAKALVQSIWRRS